MKTKIVLYDDDNRINEVIEGVHRAVYLPSGTLHMETDDGPDELDGIHVHVVQLPEEVFIADTMRPDILDQAIDIPNQMSEKDELEALKRQIDEGLKKINAAADE